MWIKGGWAAREVELEMLVAEGREEITPPR